MRGEDKIRVMRVECLKKSGCVKKSKENYINEYWSKNICYICALTPRHKPIVWADFPHWCWPCPSKSHRPPKENPNIGQKKATFELLFSLSKSLPKYFRYCCCMWFSLRGGRCKFLLRETQHTSDTGPIGPEASLSILFKTTFFHNTENTMKPRERSNQ